MGKFPCPLEFAILLESRRIRSVLSERKYQGRHLLDFKIFVNKKFSSHDLVSLCFLLEVNRARAC
jgi:hypothetical protein